jgi:hypothetical protein
VNTVIYTAGFAWEVYQTSRHFRRPEVPRIELARPPVLAEAAIARIAPAAEPCQCGEGFCWCGTAESTGLDLAATGT